MQSLRVLAAGAMLVALTAGPVAAQGLGVKGGLNLSRFSVDPEEPDVNFPYDYGPTGGIFVASGSGAVGIQVEALFSRKGTKIEDGLDEARITLDYVDFPLLLRFNGMPANGTTFFATFGPTIGVNIRARQEAPDGTETDIKDDVEQIEYGLTGGLGVQVEGISLEARYTYGFSELNKMADDGTKIRHRTVTFLLGFAF